MNPENSTARKPLRLWPGATAAVLLVLLRFVLPVVAPDFEVAGLGASLVAMAGGMLFAVVILVWWAFFSRAPWPDRLGALFTMILALVAIKFVVHPSIAGGAQGNLAYVLAFPTVGLALAVGAAAGRGLSAGPRRTAMVVSLLIGCGVWMLARSEGVGGGDIANLEWRWTMTAEERLLAQGDNDPKPIPALPAPAAIVNEPVAAATADPSTSPGAGTPAAGAAAPAVPKIDPAVPPKTETVAGLATSERGVGRVEWPGFRGPERDSIIRGVRINTDWSAAPPVELWRRPIGPGWSSFAVSGDFLYTQEQRGDDEMVACYRVSTGEPVWRHRDAVRFYESNGGAGPRGTPTLSDGRVFSLGATGILNALDAGTGAVVWSHNTATDTSVPVPFWGIASSPLVLDGKVIAAVSGALIAYDAVTGDRRWFMKSRGGSYSSPHLVTIGGVDQILLMGGQGTTSVSPADGTVLWVHAWAGTPMVQPAVLAGGDLLITTADAMGGLGTRRLALAHEEGGWAVEERWTSRGLKPYFNDYVIHKGHAFGFDGSILSSIDMADGTRKWKGGRYGNGQLVLLADQDLLLVMAEEGELALVSATTDQFTELARFTALNAKTWNHPVLVGHTLLVRNGEEMAAFRLALAGPVTDSSPGK